MKNSTLLFGLAALLSVTNALSQTLAERQVITANYDQQALTLLEDELRKDFETNQRIAFEMAAQKGWETHMTLPNGEESFNIFEIRFKNGRKEFYKNTENLRISIGDILAVEGSPGHDVGSVSLAGELVKVQMKKRNVSVASSEIKKIYRK